MISIILDPIHEKVNLCRAEADAVNEVICKMDFLFQQLKCEWEGDASKTYIVRYKKLRPDLKRTEKLIRDIASYLESIAKMFDKVDISIANQFKN